MSHTSLDNQAMRERMRREILSRADRIPPLPDVVVRVLALLNDPETVPEQLERALLDDQVLVGKVLGMVNSAFFGLNRKITGVKDAIMVLGFRGLRSLLLAASTAGCLGRDYKCYGHSDKGLSRHSLAVATGSATLAKITQRDVGLREELFVAGLLHDIGKMPLAPYVVERGVTLVGEQGESIELERRLIGIDHTEAGALVCAKWNLSESVQDIVKHHHDDGCPEELQISCAVVRLADALAHERGMGYLEGQVPETSFLDQDLETLGLAGDDWEAARQTVTDEVDTALDSFERIVG